MLRKIFLIMIFLFGVSNTAVANDYLNKIVENAAEMDHYSAVTLLNNKASEYNRRSIYYSNKSNYYYGKYLRYRHGSWWKRIRSWRYHRIANYYKASSRNYAQYSIFFRGVAAKVASGALKKHQIRGWWNVVYPVVDLQVTVENWKNRYIVNMHKVGIAHYKDKEPGDVIARQLGQSEFKKMITGVLNLGHVGIITEQAHYDPANTKLLAVTGANDRLVETQTVHQFVTAEDGSRLTYWGHSQYKKITNGEQAKLKKLAIDLAKRINAGGWEYTTRGVFRMPDYKTSVWKPLPPKPITVYGIGPDGKATPINSGIYTRPTHVNLKKLPAGQKGLVRCDTFVDYLYTRLYPNNPSKWIGGLGWYAQSKEFKKLFANTPIDTYKDQKMEVFDGLEDIHSVTAHVPPIDAKSSPVVCLDYHPIISWWPYLDRRVDQSAIREPVALWKEKFVKLPENNDYAQEIFRERCREAGYAQSW